MAQVNTAQDLIVSIVQAVNSLGENQEVLEILKKADSEIYEILEVSQGGLAI